MEKRANPKARAKQLEKHFGKLAAAYQKGRISALKDYVINSEYENQVLIEIEKI